MEDELKINSITEALTVAIVYAFIAKTDTKKKIALQYVSDFMDLASLKEVGEAMLMADLKLKELKVEEPRLGSLNKEDLN